MVFFWETSQEPLTPPWFNRSSTPHCLGHNTAEASLSSRGSQEFEEGLRAWPEESHGRWWGVLQVRCGEL